MISVLNYDNSVGFRAGNEEDIVPIDCTKISEDLLTLVRKSYLLYVAYHTMALPIHRHKRNRRRRNEQNGEDSDIETYAARLKKLCVIENKTEKFENSSNICFQDENQFLSPKTKRSRPPSIPLQTIEDNCRNYQNSDCEYFEAYGVTLKKVQIVVTRLPEDSLPKSEFTEYTTNIESESVLVDKEVNEEFVQEKKIEKEKEQQQEEEEKENEKEQQQQQQEEEKEQAEKDKENSTNDRKMQAVRRLLSMMTNSFKVNQSVSEDDTLSSDEIVEFNELFESKNTSLVNGKPDEDERMREFWKSRRKYWQTNYKEDVREFLGFEPDSEPKSVETETESETEVHTYHKTTPARRSSSSTIVKVPKWQRRISPKISFSRSGRLVKPPELVDL